MQTASSQPSIDRFASILTDVGRYKNTLGTISSEQSCAGIDSAPLDGLLLKVNKLMRYFEMVHEVASSSKTEKQLCIKYKDLPKETVLSLKKDNICWKYSLLLAEKFKQVVEKEFSPVIKLYQYYGDIEFCDYFNTRVGLLTTVVQQFIDLFSVAIKADKDDILQLEEDSEILSSIKVIEERVCIGEKNKVHKKYLSLGWKFKTLKVSFAQSDKSLFKALLNFPYYFVFNNRLETRSNQFFANPDQPVLSEVWNAPNSLSIAKWSMRLLSTPIRASADIYFNKSFLPPFSFDSVVDKSYLSTIEQCKEKYVEHAKNWDMFKQRPSTDASAMRATILASTKITPGALPLGDNTKHTVILYSGGGGFLANLQMIQEGFLKKWVTGTGVTVIEMHYPLSPENKYPVPVQDLLNMYLQLVWQYKLVQGIEDLQVLLMGDSAGGAIMLSVVNILAHLNTELPSEVVAIYPPVDLRLGRFLPSMLHSLDDQLLYFTVAKTCFEAYVPSDTDGKLANDWILSSGLAPDSVFCNYPKTLFLLGENDSLRDDVTKMVHKMRSSGSNPRLIVADNLYHGFLGFQLPLGFGVDEVDSIHRLLQQEIVRAISQH